MIELFKDRRTRQPMQFLLVLFLFYFIPFLLDQILVAADIRYFNDDMLILSWTYQLFDPLLLKNDYITDYVRTTGTTPVYYAIVKLWTLFLSPFYLHKFMPLTLWLITGVAVFIAARRLTGQFNAWLTVSIYLLSQVFLSRMAGGLEHTFAFPLLWCMLASVLSGSTWWAAACVVASAVLYPLVTPIAGMTMAVWMLFPKFSRAEQGCTHDRWPFLKRFCLLAATAIISAACVAPLVLNTISHTEYGDRLDPVRDKAEFPELVQDVPKNIISAERNPWMFFFFPFVFQYSGAFGAVAGFLISFAVGLVITTGVLVKALHDPRIGRLRPFFLSAVLCFMLGYFFRPGEMYRDLIYPLTILCVVVLPIVMRRICRFFGMRRNQKLLLLVVMGMHMVFLGHTTADASGYFFKMAEDSHALVRHAAGMDKDAVFAGLPYDFKNEAPIELYPYFAQKKAFYYSKASFTDHKEYMLTMRKRMLALIDAYYAADEKALIRLRDEFGVHYLLIDSKQAGHKQTPKYSEPFDSHMKQVVASPERRQHFYSALINEHSVYSHGAWNIVDISRIGK